jgi:uncharacterized protein (TIGR04255 family)
MKKKMANAPIFYTLGFIRFNAILNMEEFIARIQTALREDYPDFTTDAVAEVKIQVAGPGKPPTVNTVSSPRWNFRNAATTSAFSLTTASILFHTTEYEDSDSLVAEMLKGLKVVHQHARLAYIESVAIRMLDAVIPKETKPDLSQYLKPGPLGLHGIVAGQLTQSVSQATFDTSSGKAVSRAILLSGNLGFPSDLQPMTLKIGERFKTKGLHAILDNQCEMTKRVPVNFESIEQCIRTVKSKAAEPFWNSITEKAEKMWG